MSTKSLKINFGKNAAGHDWVVVNDTVMGGATNSSITITRKSLIFKGNVSLANNGGFASIRSADGPYDLSIFTKVSIRFKSNGRRFAVRLALNNSDLRANYKHHFKGTSGIWEEITMQLVNFKAYHKGTRKYNDSINSLETIVRIGVLLSDGQEGPFQLEIDNINFS